MWPTNLHQAVLLFSALWPYFITKQKVQLLTEGDPSMNSHCIGMCLPWDTWMHPDLLFCGLRWFLWIWAKPGLGMKQLCPNPTHIHPASSSHPGSQASVYTHTMNKGHLCCEASLEIQAGQEEPSFCLQPNFAVTSKAGAQLSDSLDRTHSQTEDCMSPHNF